MGKKQSEKLVMVTVRLSKDLARRARLYAAVENQTVQEVVHIALSRFLPLTVADVLRPHVERAKRMKKARGKRRTK